MESLNALLFLVRLPFFVVGALFLAGFGIVALCLGIWLGMLVVIIGVPIWLVVLFPGSIIVAAFSNNAQVITIFFRWTWEAIIGQTVEWIRLVASDFFRTYMDMGKWLVGTK